MSKPKTVEDIRGAIVVFRFRSCKTNIDQLNGTIDLVSAMDEYESHREELEAKIELLIAERERLAKLEEMQVFGGSTMKKAIWSYGVQRLAQLQSQSQEEDATK